MKLFKRSLRNRFFFSLITLVFGASILIAGVTIYQYQEEAEHYQKDRLSRKVAAIMASINYQIENTTYPVTTRYIPLIFKDKIYEISHIHNTQVMFYDLDGNLLKSSEATFLKQKDQTELSDEILQQLKESVGNHYSFTMVDEHGHKIQKSFSYITDRHFKPLAILSLPHIVNDGFLKRELRSFLLILGQVYLLLIVVAVVLSYFFSRYITKSIDRISRKIYATRVDRQNQKILIKNVPTEITGLIKAYNAMVDELEDSAVKLATSEREQAWREMAKQVAHEVKNPLTPMRLNIQSFTRNFDASAPDNEEKIKAFSQTLIQQIDTMSTIASAFSDFAKMPEPQNELLNVIEVVEMALEIFNDNHMTFTAQKTEAYAYFDRTQLIRVVTNLIKNADQACKHRDKPEINVWVGENEEMAIIKVEDNGEGISEANKNRIFEPKFTTKSSGMGLGLGIIKKIIETYKGKIYFESTRGKGTIFTVEIPKHTKS